MKCKPNDYEHFDEYVQAMLEAGYDEEDTLEQWNEFWSKF